MQILITTLRLKLDLGMLFLINTFYLNFKSNFRTMYHLTKYLHVGDTLPVIYPDSKLIRADYRKFREENLKKM
jgi:hypothetical protein